MSNFKVIWLVGPKLSLSPTDYIKRKKTDDASSLTSCSHFDIRRVQKWIQIPSISCIKTIKKGKNLHFKQSISYKIWVWYRKKPSFSGSLLVVHMYSHFPAGSTKCTPPRILLLGWSHVLIHMLLQWLATILAGFLTGTEHLYARDNWPEQIHKWHLHLLLCTKLWSVVRTPGRSTRIYQLAEVQRSPEEDFA